MKADLLAKLRGNAGLAAIVGARVHWLQRPRGGELPALTLTIVGPGRGYTHAGADALSNPRVRCECWGRSYLEAGLVADALTPAIEAKETVGATAFAGAFLQFESDGPAPDTTADGIEVFRTIRDFAVWWRAA